MVSVYILESVLWYLAAKENLLYGTTAFYSPFYIPIFFFFLTFRELEILKVDPKPGKSWYTIVLDMSRG